MFLRLQEWINPTQTQLKSIQLIATWCDVRHSSHFNGLAVVTSLDCQLATLHCNGHYFCHYFPPCFSVLYFFHRRPACCGIAHSAPLPLARHCFQYGIAVGTALQSVLHCNWCGSANSALLQPARHCFQYGIAFLHLVQCCSQWTSVSGVAGLVLWEISTIDAMVVFRGDVFTRAQ